MISIKRAMRKLRKFGSPINNLRGEPAQYHVHPYHKRFSADLA